MSGPDLTRLRIATRMARESRVCVALEPDRMLALLDLVDAQASEIAAQAKQLDDVRALHTGKTGWCLACVSVYPCPTIRAITDPEGDQP